MALFCWHYVHKQILLAYHAQIQSAHQIPSAMERTNNQKTTDAKAMETLQLYTQNYTMIPVM